MVIALAILALITLAVVVDITRSPPGDEPPRIEDHRDPALISTAKIVAKIVIDLERRS